MLNLVAGQNVSGFDVKLNYTNPQSGILVRADNLFYSPNIFGDAASNYVSTECVPGGSAPSLFCETSDITDKTFGWVHFSALSENGNPVIGPLTARLFSVSFIVNQTARGSSLIHINAATAGKPGPAPFYTTEFIPTATEDAIFSNSGIAAFFNYLPTDTPSVVAGHSNSFDASGSFNADNPSVPIVTYNWEFDDGNSGTGKVVPHTFQSPGTYHVNLTVTDANNVRGSTQRIVVVGPALGALLLYVYSLQKVPQQGVLVRIFNASVSLPFQNATTDSGGQVIFINLLPGDYILAFSGLYVTNRTLTETVIAGWTAQYSVGIQVDPPPPPPPTPWYGGTVFFATMAGALGIFGLGLFLRRRSTRNKLRARRTNFKKRQSKG